MLLSAYSLILLCGTLSELTKQLYLTVVPDRPVGVLGST